MKYQVEHKADTTLRIIFIADLMHPLKSLTFPALKIAIRLA